MSNFYLGLLCVTFLALFATTEQACGNHDDKMSENLDLIFLLDGSGSIGRENFELMKNWVILMSELLKSSDGKIHIGVIQYSYAVFHRPLDKQPFLKTEIPLGPHQNRTQLEESVSAIRYQGQSTYTARALLKSIQDFKSSGRFNDTSTRKVLILLTDGAASDADDLPNAVGQVREAGIITYAVGVGDGVNERELEIIAGSDKVVVLSDFNSLLSIANDFSASISTRPENLDLIFLLDGSGSIGQENFELMKNWVIQMSDCLDLSDGSIHVGVIQYSYAILNRPLEEQPFLKTEIPLGPHQDQIQFNESVSAMSLQGHTTYTAEALLKSILDFKSSSRFYDSSTRKVLILLTDGVATDVDQLPNAVKQIRDAGIMTFAVGVGNKVDREELELITGDDGTGKVFAVEDFDSLPLIADEVSNEISQDDNIMTV